MRAPASAPAGRSGLVRDAVNTQGSASRPGALPPTALVISVNMAAADLSDEAVAALEQRVAELLGRMTLAEKIGQMNQLNASDDVAGGPLREHIRAGRVGAVLNLVDPDGVNALPRVAVQQSRLGIPLLVVRDVIHGFRSVLPIQLGQSATLNPDIVR